ncbi:Signal recognition particle 54 kDa protein 1 [Dichanthelium oligosanthes]|uniref:Signal recognition particle 54 kDa protein 1 n=1 Tax=Dichanthelium oligosanthes TaxID=888268 RepID=A0A1E5UPQ2_9POAL|nr:Signal recognition particle 54 kDa protein 1 [Dichanthelium oligosanthes]
MVLVELGGSIARALAQMSAATIVDDKAPTDCLNEISRALLQADVCFETVRAVQSNIKAMQRAVAGELCRMLDLGKPPLALVKGKPSVVMFIGLQGSGNTRGRPSPRWPRRGWPAAARLPRVARYPRKAAGVGELLLTSFDPFADTERGDDEDGGAPVAPRDDLVHLRTQQRNGRKSLTMV